MKLDQYIELFMFWEAKSRNTSNDNPSAVPVAAPKERIFIKPTSKSSKDLIVDMEDFDLVRAYPMRDVVPNLSKSGLEFGETLHTSTNAPKWHKMAQTVLRMNLRRVIPHSTIKYYLGRAGTSGDSGIFRGVVEDVLKGVLTEYARTLMKTDKTELSKKPITLSLEDIRNKLLVGFKTAEAARKKARSKRNLGEDTMKSIFSSVYLNGKRQNFSFADYIAWRITENFDTLYKWSEADWKTAKETAQKNEPETDTNNEVDPDAPKNSSKYANKPGLQRMIGFGTGAGDVAVDQYGASHE